MTKQMTKEEHRQRHIELHRYLDELLADYLMHNSGSLPSTTTIMDLMRWSYLQTQDPTEYP
jgi:hypothetical protein